ncbi:Asp-tRNA(Asn)/Glu-tRNA(Gln) amidotransferase subunit GatA [Candidatus Saccharibacteria bacterium]|nr:Asp-tRNA(Asn)/Glu-tRNA(Gln) amidotransferase subunit GatA [Candidatus Saccharibacteria bacterium]
MDEWPKISDIANRVQSGELKPIDLVKKSIGIIDQKAEYRAVISSMEERAMHRATEIENRIGRGGNIGRLAGVPFIAKDNFLTLGGETTAASNILRGFRAPYQATVIERLEAEGAICIAKSNLDAFAHGSSTENSDWFTTKNPHDKSRVPGGSSGGSAAAVILNMVPFALGTDTGGSIRLPASFVGAVGVKPTYGLVSRSGVVAMASSTDVVGPLTTNVEDASLILDIIAGKDSMDSTTIEREESYLNTGDGLRGKRVGIISEYLNDGLDSGVRSVIDKAIDKIKSAGATISRVSLPNLPLSLASYYIICPAEVSSNLSRYDGQRFGYSHRDSNDLAESYELSREKGFGAEAKRRIMIGTYVLSSGYYDAYYKKAQLVRTKIINEFSEVFKNQDLLIGPTSPTVAFKIGDRVKDPLKMYLADMMTVGANMSGNPAMSIPAGNSNGLPVGLQLIGPMRGDRQMLAAAQSFEGLE